MAVVSQPFDRGCKVPVPGSLDNSLGEFWEDSPWKIMEQHNQSAYEENRTFLNLDGESFVDVSFLTGLNSEGDGRSVAAADFQNDGRCDLIVRQVGGGPLMLYENNFETGNYLRVSLRGHTNNSHGIGSLVTAATADLTQHRTLYPSNTYDSQAPASVHFGLGNDDVVEKLTVLWPNGERQTFSDVLVNQHIIITDDETEWATVVPGGVIAP